MSLVSDVMKGTARSAVFHKVRLYIEYAMLVAILVLSAFALYTWARGKSLESDVLKLETAVANSDARVKEVEEANAQQVEAIKTIQNLTASQTTLVASISEDLQKVFTRDKNNAARLSALERSNAALTRYLDDAIPTPVGCVLDNSCTSKDASGGNQNAAPAPAEVPSSNRRPR